MTGWADWYQGKKVLVTGGSSGIGRSTALQLARAGAHVYIAARDRDRLAQTLKVVREAAASQEQRTGLVSMDVSDRRQVREAANVVLDGLGGLDVLIANTGYARAGWVHELSDDAFDEMLQVNFMGHVNVVRAFLGHFRAHRQGDICLVSSLLGLFGAFGYTAYSASKYAIRGFAESLRHELRPQNIRVSIFYPPTTETPGLDQENSSKPPAVWAYESDSGFNRIYQPDEVATALLKSIPRGRFENVIGLDSGFLRFMFSHFPRFSRWLSDRELQKALAKSK